MIVTFLHQFNSSNLSNLSNFIIRSTFSSINHILQSILLILLLPHTLTTLLPLLLRSLSLSNLLFLPITKISTGLGFFLITYVLSSLSLTSYISHPHIFSQWNLYGLSGPSQQHQARSLLGSLSPGLTEPLHQSPDHSFNPINHSHDSPLVHHHSLTSPPSTDLESNASLTSGTSSSHAGSTNLNLPAGWNHTSPRGPLYVVPAIVIASLFIAISVVGTVVCLVGRRRTARRRRASAITPALMEESDLHSLKQHEIVLPQASTKPKARTRLAQRVKQFTIIQIRNPTSRAHQPNLDHSSIVIIDESRTRGRRNIYTALNRLTNRRRTRQQDLAPQPLHTLKKDHRPLPQSLNSSSTSSALAYQSVRQPVLTGQYLFSSWKPIPIPYFSFIAHHSISDHLSNLLFRRLSTTHSYTISSI